MTARLPITLTQAYGAYGASSGNPGSARIAYAGEMREADTGWYLLGERPYSPTLRRFLAPDHASPFDGGGVNRYAYCGGDPVNRIDPSGHTWLGWLGTSLGISAATSAARSVTPASRMQESASTPGTMTSTASTVADAVSVTAAIDSVALMMSGQQKAGDVFGWVGMGAEIASGGVHLPPARHGSPVERFLGRQHAVTRTGITGTRPKRNVQLVTDANIPAERLDINTFGALYLKTGWKRRRPPGNRKSSIVAADTAISAESFTTVFKWLLDKGVSEVSVYTGAHGVPMGNNWNLRTGERLDAEPKFFLEDVVRTKRAAQSAGMKITPINMALMTKQEMQHHLLRDGVHVIGSCYGVSDEVVMNVLNVTQATVYKLNSPVP